MILYVPVVSKESKPLMPTTPARARKWIKSKKATPFWNHGVFCVRLNVDPSDIEKQEICVGIDPGSKKEGYTVKSSLHTYLNINADAVTHVKKRIETRKIMRRHRRYRKTPCRKNRNNRATLRKKGRIPPSTKARWQWKLRTCKWLQKMFPIVSFVVEDIKAVTKKNKRKWNASFSPIETGKNWFYTELKKLGTVDTLQGYETKSLRDQYGLYKTKNKMSETFDAHCVDSWVLANWKVGGHTNPDNTSILCITPLEFHRRQLHVMVPIKGGIRKKYGGTRSMGFTRGSIVKHTEFGFCYIGGTSIRNKTYKISVHSLETGERITKDVLPEECKFKCYNSWRSYIKNG